MKERRTVALVCSLCLMGVMAPAQAPERGSRSSAAAAGNTEPKEDTVPIPPEAKSVTTHDLNIGGKTLHYTATAGTC